MIYCIKYIRINLRALLDAIATIRFKENFKAIGQTAIKGFSLSFSILIAYILISIFEHIFRPTTCFDDFFRLFPLHAIQSSTNIEIDKAKEGN